MNFFKTEAELTEDLITTRRTNGHLPWTPLINTPPFPTYTSGHSTFSGAAAAILTSEIGNNIAFTDSSKMADGFLPRSFINFNMAAQEAAVSRLYGGIHYSFDNENGYKCGQLIADNVKYLKW